MVGEGKQYEDLVGEIVCPDSGCCLVCVSPTTETLASLSPTTLPTVTLAPDTQAQATSLPTEEFACCANFGLAHGAVFQET